MTQALHAIAEQLAAKEMEIAPKEFIHRETIHRSRSKFVKNRDSAEIFHDIDEQMVERQSSSDEEETKGQNADAFVAAAATMGSRPRHAASIKGNLDDDDDEDFFDALDTF